MCIRKISLVWLILIQLFLAGCAPQGYITPTSRVTDTSDTIEYAPDPTPAATLDELVINLSSDNPRVRVVSAFTLEKYGKDAIVAIPALRVNLSYERYWEVRESAAQALGRLGFDAKEAIPDLVQALSNEGEISHVREAAAYALGEIAGPEIVPTLVPCIYFQNLELDENLFLSISCAEAIEKLTGKMFVENKVMGHALDNQGIPTIVKEARKWWETEGQYQDWEQP
jgi:HEAT repeat protein